MQLKSDKEKLMKVIRFIIGAFLDLPKQFRLSYLPPLLVYLAAGISGLTAIVGTFFIKDYLNLSAAFLAGLGFWAGLPWALKMPLGHLVDLIWKHKNYMVYFGALIIAASLLIMHGLIGHTQAMATILPVETWYVVSVILAPIGFVVQDVVADAMTVEAVPKYETDGTAFSEKNIKTMHTTMQTLGRFSIISGSMLVALINVVFSVELKHLMRNNVLHYTRMFMFTSCDPISFGFGSISCKISLIQNTKSRHPCGSKMFQPV